MTKNELKAALDLAGVSYAKKANLETLTALYAALHPAEGGAPYTQVEVEQGIAAIEAEVAPPTPAAALATGTGLKIEKDRDEQNGIKRPSIGGKCRAIWDALDVHAETTGDDPTAKDVKAMAADHGWNPNNASIEFYQWRKFNGVNSKPKV